MLYNVRYIPIKQSEACVKFEGSKQSRPTKKEQRKTKEKTTKTRTNKQTNNATPNQQNRQSFE